MPVINENDTTTTDEISFGDNDLLSAQVAVLLGADLLVLLTDTAGLYTADPRLNPGADLVPDVRDFAELEGCRSAFPPRPWAPAACARRWWRPRWPPRRGSRPRSARGSMPAAVATALAGGAHRHPVPPAAGPRVSSFKLWLRYAKPSRGRLTVDDGAERALRERGTSLLPVGVTAVEGEFQAGDAVEVRGDVPGWARASSTTPRPSWCR